MRTYIKKLQAKNEMVRRQIFIGLMFFSMAFVGFIWIYNLTDRYDSKVKEQAHEDLKPFKLFANSLSNTYKNITASVGSVKKINTTEEKSNPIIINNKQIDLVVVEEPIIQ